MNTLMEYIIKAEESAISDYLYDIEFDMNMCALEATEVVDAPTAVVSAKPKRSFWDIIKAFFARIAQIFKWIFGISNEIIENAENKQDQSNTINTANSNTTNSESSNPSTVKKPRSIQPSINSNQQGLLPDKHSNSAEYRKPLVEKLNKARAEYAKATESAVAVIFDTADASCSLLNKIKSGWGVPRGNKFDAEIERIDSLYRKSNEEYNNVLEAREEYDSVKNQLSSFKNLSRFLTYMNIDHIKPICDKIKKAAKDHWQYCNDFCKSIDNARNKYKEDVSQSDQNTYRAAKQYLDIAKLANKAIADFRRCAADVFN